VSLDDPDTKQMATDDPWHFLSMYKNGAIIDEAQRVPALFSYLQGILDNTKKNRCLYLRVALIFCCKKIFRNH
jgi:hypothetical protein